MQIEYLQLITIESGNSNRSVANYRHYSHSSSHAFFIRVLGICGGQVECTWSMRYTWLHKLMKGRKSVTIAALDQKGPEEGWLGVGGARLKKGRQSITIATLDYKGPEEGRPGVGGPRLKLLHLLGGHSRETRVKCFWVWLSTLWPINVKVKALLNPASNPRLGAHSCRYRQTVAVLSGARAWPRQQHGQEADTTCRLTCRTLICTTSGATGIATATTTGGNGIRIRIRVMQCRYRPVAKQKQLELLPNVLRVHAYYTHETTGNCPHRYPEEHSFFYPSNPPYTRHTNIDRPCRAQLWLKAFPQRCA